MEIFFLASSVSQNWHGSSYMHGHRNRKANNVGTPHRYGKQIPAVSRNERAGNTKCVTMIYKRCHIKCFIFSCSRNHNPRSQAFWFRTCAWNVLDATLRIITRLCGASTAYSLDGDIESAEENKDYLPQITDNWAIVEVYQDCQIDEHGNHQSNYENLQVAPPSPPLHQSHNPVFIFYASYIE